MLKALEFLKISVSDVIETLGLVMSRPWEMAAAVCRGGNSLENALVYFFVVFSASALIVLLPFNLGDAFAERAQYLMVTAFLVLAVTSVVFFAGLRLAGIHVPFHKALAIKAFLGGAYVLVVSVATALATALIMSLDPGEKDAFAALTLGCVPMFDMRDGMPVIVAPHFGFSIYVAISLLSLGFGLFLLVGAFAGLAPFRRRGRMAYVAIAVVVILLDYALSAAFAGRNLNATSAACEGYRSLAEPVGA